MKAPYEVTRTHHSTPHPQRGPLTRTLKAELGLLSDARNTLTWMISQSGPWTVTLWGRTGHHLPGRQHLRRCAERHRAQHTDGGGCMSKQQPRPPSGTVVLVEQVKQRLPNAVGEPQGLPQLWWQSEACSAGPAGEGGRVRCSAQRRAAPPPWAAERRR